MDSMRYIGSTRRSHEKDLAGKDIGGRGYRFRGGTHGRPLWLGRWWWIEIKAELLGSDETILKIIPDY